MGDQSLIKKIVANGLLAAIYFVLCILCGQFAYGPIQFRISEILVLLCFFRPDFIWGVTIGTFLANIMSISMFGPWDMIFGTLATLIAAVGCAYLSPRLLVACAWPVLVNAVVVGLELWLITETPFWLNFLTVGGGELAVIAAGYVLLLFLIRRPSFTDSLSFTRHVAVKW